MTATTQDRPATPHVTPRFPGMAVTQRRAIVSEWTKFRSLRSTLITLAVSVVLTVGLGTLISAVRVHHLHPDDLINFPSVVTSLNGVRISQLAVGVLGVVLITGEYATGMIRASLTAVPKRLPVLWAKLTVFTVVVGIAALVSTFAAFFLGQQMLASKHLDVGIGAPHALRMVVGAAVYLVLVGLIGMAFGALLRNTAAGISTLVGLFFVIPPVLDLLPTSWADNIGPYLPSNAGEAFWGRPDGAHLSPTNGLIVLLAWTAVVIAAAAFRLVTTDA